MDPETYSQVPLTEAEQALKKAVEENAVQYTQLCRICLVTAERNFKNMTRAVFDTIPYFTIYLETVGKQVKPFGNFSPRICATCEIEMLEAYKFRKKCLLTDDKIAKMLEHAKPMEPQPTPIKQERWEEASRVHSRTEAANRENNVDVKPGGNNLPKAKKYRCKVCRVIFDEYDDFRVHKCMSCEPKIIKDMRAIYTEKKKEPPPKKVPHFSTEAKKKRSRNKKEYTCEQCGKMCQSRQGFLLHMDKHNDTARYDCDQCDKKFRHWQSRRTHIYRVHLKKPFCSCPQCGKSFYQIKYMKQHILEQHSNFNGYQCEKCGKNFQTKGAFADHQNNHKGDVPCKICGKVLKTRKTYFRHLETHTGERNYICPVCDKRYTCNFTMKKHVKRSHPDQTHLLPPDGTIVNQRYLRKAGLEKGEKRKKGVKSEDDPQSSTGNIEEGGDEVHEIEAAIEAIEESD
ncbi:zinc finger protein 221-like [Phlebotomus argentipes]|uniref:zinc finger protein 221-like n=1 Tax=Phlebotomus argentipes TaxID=94469 RepID=UPI0028931DEE|nr:zinc finger protein 221-like [Phlebotomus argentipes]